MKSEDPSSMENWYPLIKDLPIPQPKTIFVKITECEKSHEKLRESLVTRVRKVIEAQFKLPVFIRTDQASGKHAWELSCYYTGKFNNPKRKSMWATPLHQHLFEVISFNQCAGILGLDYNSIVLREFIKMDGTFTAFYGNMPVNSERRYFINDGKILCKHHYWILEALVDFEKSSSKYSKNLLPKDWRAQLSDLNVQSPEEKRLLTYYTKLVAKNFKKGYWSVDYCKGADGTWYLIDMAEGQKSWHPPCKKHTKVMKNYKMPFL